MKITHFIAFTFTLVVIGCTPHIQLGLGKNKIYIVDAETGEAVPHAFVAVSAYHVSSSVEFWTNETESEFKGMKRSFSDENGIAYVSEMSRVGFQGLSIKKGKIWDSKDQLRYAALSQTHQGDYRVERNENGVIIKMKRYDDRNAQGSYLRRNFLKPYNAPDFEFYVQSDKESEFLSEFIERNLVNADYYKGDSLELSKKIEEYSNKSR